MHNILLPARHESETLIWKGAVCLRIITVEKCFKNKAAGVGRIGIATEVQMKGEGIKYKADETICISGISK